MSWRSISSSAIFGAILAQLSQPVSHGSLPIVLWPAQRLTSAKRVAATGVSQIDDFGSSGFGMNTGKAYEESCMLSMYAVAAEGMCRAGLLLMLVPVTYLVNCVAWDCT